MRPASNIHFVKVGNGRLALFHRPRKDDFTIMKTLGCTHVITLLKDSEGSERYGDLCKNAGMEWIWLPIPNGKYPEGEVHAHLLEAMPELSGLLDDGKSILIHCSAGIHRTGTVAYGLLRWRGMSSKQAMSTIGKIRKETAEGMMEKRMRWGNENARPASQQDKTWLHSVRKFANRLKMKLSRSR